MRTHTTAASLRVVATTLALLSAACGEPTSSLSRLSPTDAARLLVGADTTDIRVGALDGTRADIRGINNLGQVTGAFDPGGRQNVATPYRWTAGSGFTAITPLSASTAWGNDINDAGVVVGTAAMGNITGDRAAVATGTAMVNLGLLPGADFESNSRAVAINAAGLIVGSSQTWNTSDPHAVLWDQARTIHDLGTLGGTFSTAVDINAVGQVIGMSTVAGGAQHAFVWTAGTGMQDLNTQMGAALTNVVAINDAGQIAGDFTTTGGQTHAFLYTPGTGLRDLGTLGGSTSTVTGLNNHGQVVGASTTTGGSTSAFLWTDTEGMEDITALTGVPDVRKLNDRLQTLTGALYVGIPRIITLAVVPRAWPFVGFLPPIDAPPAFNGAKAGGTVTLRFSLGGDRGLNIFQPGSPSRAEVSCTTGADLRAPVPVPASAMTLRYERGPDRYVLKVVTENAWAQRCGRLTLALQDGSTHSALFHFTK